eukprot:scaffold107777_cov37-Tisochrysis_lutea.AAC.3
MVTAKGFNVQRTSSASHLRYRTLPCYAKAVDRGKVYLLGARSRVGKPHQSYALVTFCNALDM